MERFIQVLSKAQDVSAAGALVLACFLEEPKNTIATASVNASEL